MPIHQCNRCRLTDPPPKRCAGCQKAWYCSSECQKRDWVSHIFNCNPKRQINTADYLALAVERNIIPEHCQTCDDYGFYKATYDQRELLVVYGWLLDPKCLGVKPMTLHKWRVQGTLAENIKQEMTRIPDLIQRHHPAFSWFLRNQSVFDGNSRPLEVATKLESAVRKSIRDTWCFLGRPPGASWAEIEGFLRSLPPYKKECHQLYDAILSGGHPGPHNLLWVYLGFCACKDRDGESALHQLYDDLIHRCTFEEFCDAYKSRSIPDLFRTNGLDIRDPLIVAALSSRTIKSVWYLKQYVESRVIHAHSPHLFVLRHPTIDTNYGFANCRTDEEQDLLLNLYKGFFALGPQANPLELQKSTVERRLFAYFTEDLSFKLRPKKLYRRLLRKAKTPSG